MLSWEDVALSNQRLFEVKFNRKSFSISSLLWKHQLHVQCSRTARDGSFGDDFDLPANIRLMFIPVTTFSCSLFSFYFFHSENIIIFMFKSHQKEWTKNWVLLVASTYNPQSHVRFLTMCFGMGQQLFIWYFSSFRFRFCVIKPIGPRGRLLMPCPAPPAKRCYVACTRR